jgi:uncharacterized protein YuzE
MSTQARQNSPGFGLNVSARADGTLEAAYLRISENQVARTEELVESVLMVDFDRDGDPVGIEILAPVSFNQIMAIVGRLAAPQRQPFENFVRSSAPPGLVRT